MCEGFRARTGQWMVVTGERGIGPKQPRPLGNPRRSPGIRGLPTATRSTRSDNPVQCQVTGPDGVRITRRQHSLARYREQHGGTHATIRYR